MAVIEMAVSEWVDVPDNPRQRNTIKRASYAVRNHLSAYCKVHRYVWAASKGGAILCKLDGHARSYLWHEGILDLPPDGKVEVLLVEVSGLAEAKKVYDHLDSPPASKKPSDTVYGAARENKFELHSPLLRSCQFATQLKVADSGKRFAGDIYTLVRKWKGELIELDKLNLTSNYTVLIATMLTSIRRDGTEAAGPFWTMLDSNEGAKSGRYMDGPEALHQLMEVRRAQNQTAGYENLIIMASYAWDAYVRWLDSKKIQRLKLADFHAVVDGLNTKDMVECQ